MFTFANYISESCFDNLWRVALLFLGSLGQLGTGLAKTLRAKYGRNNVIMSDIIRPDRQAVENGKFYNQP